MKEDDLFASFACRFHHLGLACRSIDRETQSWISLGYRQEGSDFEDPIQGVRGRFLIGPGPRLELLMPSGPESPINGMIDRGVKLYHHAFETPSMNDLLAALGAAGCKLTVAPVPAVAFAGRRIAFFLMPNMNLIELIEAELSDGSR
ncbi:VOC family protein [Lichenifustis flavocetrariae]|uniref:VOC family protein n=1 Tax=Lichenifustis flavocetrariae TaxID=2949735 RepID=A0AA41Z381_9HYPH|nr:VOC family protein [Lichenifustis flavocetrariae]MCW6509535.1 VOC family protein [Lichenifustis flavocetrariae]